MICLREFLIGLLHMNFGLYVSVWDCHVLLAFALRLTLPYSMYLHQHLQKVAYPAHDKLLSLPPPLYWHGYAQFWREK